MLAELVLKEARHRWPGTLLGALVIASAVALVHLFILLSHGVERETRIIQRDIGLNVIVIPAATEEDRYWSLGFSEHSMPEEYIERVADQQVANRLIPMLRRRVTAGGMELMLTGIAPERFKNDAAMKPVFGMQLEPGSAVVGGVVARHLGVAPGDSLTLLGSTFVVHRCLAPAGTQEDVTVYLPLRDAQQLLGLEGRINEIQALECHCAEDVQDPLGLLRAQLEPLLPDTRVLRRTDAADARRKQRLLADQTLAFATPVVLVLAGLLVSALSALNLRQRRRELGVLSALGIGAPGVVGLALGRALLVGIAGALLGLLAGEILARVAGEVVYQFARGALASDALSALLLLVCAPLFALLASLPPALQAARLDPAQVLADD